VWNSIRYYEQQQQQQRLDVPFRFVSSSSIQPFFFLLSASAVESSVEQQQQQTAFGCAVSFCVVAFVQPLFFFAVSCVGCREQCGTLFDSVNNYNNSVWSGVSFLFVIIQPHFFFAVSVRQL
jgi:hypothetical protein